jgi:hypothetical protein
MRYYCGKMQKHYSFKKKDQTSLREFIINLNTSCRTVEPLVGMENSVMAVRDQMVKRGREKRAGRTGESGRKSGMEPSPRCSEVGKGLGEERWGPCPVQCAQVVWQ